MFMSLVRLMKKLGVKSSIRHYCKSICSYKRLMAPIHFTVEQLRIFTNDFHESNRLGRGNFGVVYRGFMDEKRIAVKVSHYDSEIYRYQWETEIAHLSELQHPHIIQLIGYAEPKDHNSLYLVYNYMLCSVTRALAVLDWLRTLKILREAASVLHYIHMHSHPSLVYGNFKLNEILIDEEYNVKVGDFGTMMQEGNMTLAVSPGSICPEVITRGRITSSSDIYSFGIVILQLITKTDEVVIKEERDEFRHLTGCKHIRDWACEEFRRRKDVVDKMLIQTGCNKQNALKITRLALQCLDRNPSCRLTISEVIDILAQLEVQAKMSKTYKLMNRLRCVVSPHYIRNFSWFGPFCPIRCVTCMINDLRCSHFELLVSRPKVNQIAPQ